MSALRAWNKMRATSVAATHPMLTRHTSPGGAAVAHAGADRPRGGRRKRIPYYPTGGSRHRLSLCRPSGPGTSCEQPLLQQHTSCLPNAPAPEGRQCPMPGPTGPGVGEKRLHPLLDGLIHQSHPPLGRVARNERGGREAALCRPSGPGTSCEQPPLQQLTLC
jgi:hypothetical protein